MTKILQRRPHSGFVKYPSDFDKRIIDGLARFRTRCDMLVGPCSCGHVHQENDRFVKEMLSCYEAEIEPLILTAVNDRVPMPRYWKKPYEHRQCNMLIGDCECGKTHKINERWIVDLLAVHNTQVLGCDTTEPIIEEEPIFGNRSECQCQMCTEMRRMNAS